MARIAAPILHGYQHITGRHTPFTTGAIKAMDANRHISNELATRELDYHPRPILETVTDTMTWYRNHGFTVKPVDRKLTGP